MYIGIASSDGKSVDLHFGKADKLLIYSIIDNSLELIEKRKIPSLSTGNINHQFDPARFQQIAEIIDDCSRIYCVKIGGKPRAELDTKGIRVIEYEGAIASISA